MPCSTATQRRKRASTSDSTTQTSPTGGRDHDDRSIDPGRSRIRAGRRGRRSDDRCATGTENGRSSTDNQHTGAEHDDSRADHGRSGVDHDGSTGPVAEHDRYPHDSGIVDHPRADLVWDARAHHYAGGADLCVDPTIAAGPGTE
ncbi:hypothetical protein [Rhodococcus jostii]|uniref:hypothetical protein n=1 Tax=Rhodococcus jostii TaxID=132919 RepID=UPI0036647EC3